MCIYWAFKHSLPVSQHTPSIPSFQLSSVPTYLFSYHSIRTVGRHPQHHQQFPSRNNQSKRCSSYVRVPPVSVSGSISYCCLLFSINTSLTRYAQGASSIRMATKMSKSALLRSMRRQLPQVLTPISPRVAALTPLLAPRALCK
jgi:hypothetical protein